MVLVRAPDIEGLAGGRALPHTFDKIDGLPVLCLWWQRDWNRGMPLTTLIAWAAEWFWFFEYWLETGEWLGGGSHPVKFTPPTSRSDPQPVLLETA